MASLILQVAISIAMAVGCMAIVVYGTLFNMAPIATRKLINDLHTHFMNKGLTGKHTKKYND